MYVSAQCDNGMSLRHPGNVSRDAVLLYGWVKDVDSTFFTQSFSVIAVAAALVAYAPAKARAANKDIVELQTQVQQLMDAVQRLQSTVDAKFGLIQHLVEQTADNANRMSASVDELQKKLEAQNEAMGGKIDTIVGTDAVAE